MIQRVIEIEGSPRYLSKFRGFLVVRDSSTELGRIPLDDIAVVIAHGYAVTFSNGLLTALAERVIPLITCDERHLPNGWLLPIVGNHLHADRLRLQISSSLPLKKRMWQKIVQSKISMQASLIDLKGGGSEAVRSLLRKVRSGDSTNVEAQAARRYWPLLLGKEFRRGRESDDANGLLNYGYTVLRSSVGRSVLKAGLHPALGLHHHNARNAFCLVDDLMEPFRPVVDRIVLGLMTTGTTELTSDRKRQLAACILDDLQTIRGRTPVSTCADRLAYSVVVSLEDKTERLDLPRDFAIKSMMRVEPSTKGAQEAPKVA